MDEEKSVDTYKLPKFGDSVDKDPYYLCMTLHDDLVYYQKCGFLCDFTIHVENDKIPAHKVVLASTCEFIDTLLTTDIGGESDKSKCTLTCGSPKTIRRILKYLCSNEIFRLKMSWDNVEEYLCCADYLICDSLRRCCFHFICSELDEELKEQNFVHFAEALLLFHQFFIHPGDSDMDRFSEYLFFLFPSILRSYPSVLKESKIMKELDAETLKSLLQNEIFENVSMQDITDLIIRWVQHNPNEHNLLLKWLKYNRNNRIKQVADIFKSCVDLESLPLDYIKSIPSQIIPWKEAELDRHLQNYLKDGKRDKSNSDCIVFVHGRDEFSTTPFQCFRYIISEDKWENCQSPKMDVDMDILPGDEYVSNCVCADGFVYVLWWKMPKTIHGENYDRITSYMRREAIFKRYKVDGNLWEALPEPCTGQNVVGPFKLVYVAPQKKIYVITAQAEFICFDVEGSLQWEKCQSLPDELWVDRYWDYESLIVLTNATKLCYSEKTHPFIYVYLARLNRDDDVLNIRANLARYNVEADAWEGLPNPPRDNDDTNDQNTAYLNGAHLEVQLCGHHYTPQVDNGRFLLVNCLGKTFVAYKITEENVNCGWEPMNYSDFYNGNSTVGAPTMILGLFADPFYYEHYPCSVGHNVFLFDGQREEYAIDFRTISCIRPRSTRYKLKNRPKTPICVKLDTKTSKWRPFAKPPTFLNLDYGSFCVVPGEK